MTTYHPTADQARGPLQKLLDNEIDEIAVLIEELRRRARNKARLEAAIAMVEANEDLPGEQTDVETLRIAAMLRSNGGKRKAKEEKAAAPAGDDPPGDGTKT